MADLRLHSPQSQLAGCIRKVPIVDSHGKARVHSLFRFSTKFLPTSKLTAQNQLEGCALADYAGDNFQKFNRIGIQLSRAREICLHGGAAIRTVKKFNNCLQVIDNMVARDGVEPQAPEFSGPILTVIAST